VIDSRWLLGCAGAGALALTAAPVAAQALPQALTMTGEDRTRAIRCLTAAIAYEAANEPVEGQQAVAEVILNRLRSPLYPKTVCGVVFAGSERRTGCQFSFTCDGSLRHRFGARVMAATGAVAAAAIDGLNPGRVAGATFYHADYVKPYWAPSLVRVAKIGAHIFYRARGRASDSLPGAVVPVGEPMIAALAHVPAAGGMVAAVPAAVATPAAVMVESRVFAPWGLVPVAGGGR